MLAWAYPDYTVAGLLAGLALGAVLAYGQRGRRLGRYLGQSVGRLGWKLPLRLLAGMALLTAWLGPSFGVSRQPVRTAGKDLWLVVDVSRSMDATDVAPSRLQRAQEELSRLVAQFPADRLGLIVFGGAAYVQCPLTYDQAALQVFVRTLSTALVPAGATSLREPLELVMHRLSGPGTSGASATGRATAAVVLSDGEDFGENLEPTLRALTRSGARVYAVGVGTAAGGRIPLAGGFLRDAQKHLVQSRLREAPLLQLAAQTGGQYFELNDQAKGLPGLLTALRTMQGTAEQVQTVAVADNHYRYPLAAALLLLAFDVVLTVTVLRP